MTDVLTKKQRSYNMSMIRGKWTKQEKLIHNYLKGRKIKHTMHPNLPGKPDVLIQGSDTVIFLDGCFWHKCPECFVKPLTNTDFWNKKIKANVINDGKYSKELRKNGYKVVRIWEHDTKGRNADFSKLLKRAI
jgi:DNA mismatch endonuclease (patch repair protein)